MSSGVMRGQLYEIKHTFVIIRLNHDLIPEKFACKRMLDKGIVLSIYLQFILYMITRESKVVLHELLSP